MKNFLNITLTLGCLLPVHCFAGEPIVNPPAASVIVSTIKPCLKPGYGKIPVGTKIEIKGRNIPSDGKWFWLYSGKSRCRKLPENPSQLFYTTYGQTGQRSGAKIKAGYGLSDSKPLFTFSFKIPEGECSEGECYYDCGPLLGTNPPEAIGCELLND